MKDRLLQLGVNSYKQLAWRKTLLPRAIEVETTKACNLRCPGCRRNYTEGSIYTEAGETHLTVEALWRIVATTPIQLLRFEGDGEPLCNPHFKDLLQFCKRMGIRSAMTSNGTLLNEEWVRFLEEHGMRRVHISFDGATKATHERTKVGANFDEVIYNCELLGKSKIQLFMNMVLFTERHMQELPAYAELATKVKATGIHCMKLQSDSTEFGNPPRLSSLENRRVVNEFRQIAKANRLTVTGTYDSQPTFVECYDPFINPFVLLNNDVYACTYMANLRRAEVYAGETIPTPYQEYKMGNLEDNWMKDIWNGEAYRQLRGVIAKTRWNDGCTIPAKALLSLKKSTVNNGRFSYCIGCLCRWGESGL